MKRKKIIIVVTLAILFIVIFGVYRFIYIQTSLSEPYEEDAEIAATEIAEEEPVTEEKVQPEIEAEDADVENIPADPLKSPEVEQGETVSFDEKYTQVTGSYAVDRDAFSPVMYDIDEDGKADKIEFLCEVSNNYAIVSLTLQVGDLKKSIINAEDISEDLIYEDLKCFILHIGEKNLIYIHTSFALDDLYFGVVCEVTESGINVLNDEAGQVSRKKETEYFLSEGFKVKTIAELAVDEMGEDDAVVESQVVLPVGTIMVPLRTDNETYVDFTSEEGKIYRVPFEVGLEDDGGRTGFIQGTVASEWMAAVV